MRAVAMAAEASAAAVSLFLECLKNLKVLTVNPVPTIAEGARLVRPGVFALSCEGGICRLPSLPDLDDPKFFEAVEAGPVAIPRDTVRFLEKVEEGLDWRAEERLQEEVMILGRMTEGIHVDEREAMRRYSLLEPYIQRARFGQGVTA